MGGRRPTATAPPFWAGRPKAAAPPHFGRGGRRPPRPYWRRRRQVRGIWGAGAPQEGQPPRLVLPSCGGASVFPALPQVCVGSCVGAAVPQPGWGPISGARGPGRGPYRGDGRPEFLPFPRIRGNPLSPGPRGGCISPDSGKWHEFPSLAPGLAPGPALGLRKWAPARPRDGGSHTSPSNVWNWS